MQLSVFEILQDFSYKDERVMMGLSGGVNSAAALAYLAEFVEEKPKELYLYYSHLSEHSADTEKFVHACVEYAKSKFSTVVFEQSNHSVLEYFENGFRGIPHPSLSPCSKLLKIDHMIDFQRRHNINKDIIGYVREEWRRIERQIQRGVKDKDYLIRHMSNEDCFSIVEKYIGWYPKIYSLRWDDTRIKTSLPSLRKRLDKSQYNIVKGYAEQGYNNMSKTYRVFKHNNCLPCKNMHQWEIAMVGIFFPQYYDPAMKLAEKLGTYWGRSAASPINESTDCAVCVV